MSDKPSSIDLNVPVIAIDFDTTKQEHVITWTATRSMTVEEVRAFANSLLEAAAQAWEYNQHEQE